MGVIILFLSVSGFRRFWDFQDLEFSINACVFNPANPANPDTRLRGWQCTLQDFIRVPLYYLQEKQHLRTAKK